jgi:hypothetical protein
MECKKWIKNECTDVTFGYQISSCLWEDTFFADELYDK